MKEVLLLFLIFSVNAMGADFEITSNVISKNCLKSVLKNKNSSPLDKGLCLFFNRASNMERSNKLKILHYFELARSNDISIRMRNLLNLAEGIIFSELGELLINNSSLRGQFCVERSVALAIINKINFSLLDISIEADHDLVAELISHYSQFYGEKRILNAQMNSSCGLEKEMDNETLNQLIEDETAKVIDDLTNGSKSKVDAILSRNIERSQKVLDSAKSRISQISSMSNKKSEEFKRFHDVKKENEELIDILVKNYKKAVLMASTILQEFKHFKNRLSTEEGLSLKVEENLRKINVELDRLEYGKIPDDLIRFKERVANLNDLKIKEKEERRKYCKIFFCQLYNPLTLPLTIKMGKICRWDSMKNNKLCLNEQGNFNEKNIKDFSERCVANSPEISQFFTHFNGDKSLQNKCLEGL